MQFDKLVIFCFSGTGNALTASKWLVDEAKEKNIEAKYISIDKNYEPDMSLITETSLIGFIFPTHGFNLAPTMLKFIRKFPSGKNKVFLMNTRAGMSIGKFVTPGLSGMALLLPSAILRAKGYKVVAARPLDMPSNWISIHPGLGPKSISKIVNYCKKTCGKIFTKISEGKKDKRRMYIDLPIDIVIFPVTLAYFLAGRFFLAKTFIYNNKCNGCGLCAKNCPAQAIVIKNNRPYWTVNCESCMRCINTCKSKAIVSSHLIFAIGLFLLLAVPFTYLFSNLINIPSSNLSYEVKELIDWTIAVILYFSIYPLFHYLSRYKFVNLIFLYSSFTTFWRHYLAPGIKQKDFRNE